MVELDLPFESAWKGQAQKIVWFVPQNATRSWDLTSCLISSLFLQAWSWSRKLPVLTLTLLSVNMVFFFSPCSTHPRLRLEFCLFSFFHFHSHSWHPGSHNLPSEPQWLSHWTIHNSFKHPLCRYEPPIAISPNELWCSMATEPTKPPGLCRRMWGWVPRCSPKSRDLCFQSIAASSDRGLSFRLLPQQKQVFQETCAVIARVLWTCLCTRSVQHYTNPSRKYTFISRT